jgi:tetratricopeptide (TPR) repeat protein
VHKRKNPFHNIELHDVPAGRTVTAASQPSGPAVVDTRTLRSPDSSAGEISPDEIQMVLETTLASRTFRSAEMQRRFLRYAVEQTIAGRGHLIKEYVIGTEALGRRESFDPRLDPIVRTEARKLRARLAKYYVTEGAEDRLRIDFPKGSYVPSFRAVDSQSPAPPDVSTAVNAIPAPHSSDERKTRPQQLWKVATVVLAATALTANFLVVQIGGRRERDLSRTSPNLLSRNPEAYQNYQRGRHFLNQFSPESLKTALAYFEQAIAADPSFARAYAALADSYVLAPQVAAAPPWEVVPKARKAARRALALDSTLGEAHFDLAVCAEYEFDWTTAEREFKKGLELTPGSALGHLWYAKYLALTGRKAEVLTHRRIAADLDPVSPYALQSVAGYFSVMGSYDQAIELFRSALTIEPRFGLSHQGLGVAYLLKGMHGEAIAELKAANELMRGPSRMALLGYAYAIAGETDEAHRILNDFLTQSRRGPFPALPIAQIYIGLGEKDRAFEWLDKAIDQRDLNCALQWDSPYETLRADRRFLSLLRRMKLV